MGLLQLKYIDGALQERAVIYQRYVELLDAALPALEYIKPASNIEWNYSYFPVLIRADSAVSRDAIYAELRKHNIYARRYFYPLISAFPMYRHFRRRMYNISRLPMKFSCGAFAPIYPGLPVADQRRIIEIIQGLFIDAAHAAEPALVVNG